MGLGFPVMSGGDPVAADGIKDVALVDARAQVHLLPRRERVALTENSHQVLLAQVRQDHGFRASGFHHRHLNAQAIVGKVPKTPKPRLVGSGIYNYLLKMSKPSLPGGDVPEMDR